MCVCTGIVFHSLPWRLCVCAGMMACVQPYEYVFVQELPVCLFIVFSCIHKCFYARVCLSVCVCADLKGLHYQPLGSERTKNH